MAIGVPVMATTAQCVTDEPPSQEFRETIAPTRIRRVAAPSLLSEPSASSNLPELQTLGSTLREARESQGLSPEALAGRLNMGLEQLQALEAGNREQLREAVFVIAQARRVAGALGVNVDGQIEALRRNPAFQAKPASTAAPSAAPQPLRPVAIQDQDSSTKPRLPLKPVLLSLLVAAGVAGGAIALQRGQLKLAIPSWPTGKASSPAPAASPQSADQASGAHSKASPVPAGTLVLTAKGRSWVEVSSSSGQTLFRGTLEGEKAFPLGKGLKVLAGRPDLVTAQLSNAEPRVLGPIDQVRWQRFGPGATAPAP